MIVCHLTRYRRYGIVLMRLRDGWKRWRLGCHRNPWVLWSMMLKRRVAVVVATEEELEVEVEEVEEEVAVVVAARSGEERGWRVARMARRTSGEEGERQGGRAARSGEGRRGARRTRMGLRRTSQSVWRPAVVRERVTVGK